MEKNEKIVEVDEVKELEEKSPEKKKNTLPLLTLICLMPNIAIKVSGLSPAFNIIASIGFGIITCLLVFMFGDSVNEIPKEESGKLFKKGEGDTLIKVVIGIILFELIFILLALLGVSAFAVWAK